MPTLPELEMPTVAYWRDKRLEDCTREELLDCIKELARFYKEHTTLGAIRAHSLGRIEMLKRGEAYDR